MGQFFHSNVIRLFGVVTVGEPVSCFKYSTSNAYRWLLDDKQMKKILGLVWKNIVIYMSDIGLIT